MINATHFGATYLTASQSATGSFPGGLLSVGGANATITVLKCIGGFNDLNVPIESMIFSGSSSNYITLSSNTKLDLVITSITLGSGSAPVFLYNT